MLPTRSSCRIAQLVQNQSTQASCAQSPSPGLPSAPLIPNSKPIEGLWRSDQNGQFSQYRSHKVFQTESIPLDDRNGFPNGFSSLRWNCVCSKSGWLDIDIVLGKWPILSRDRFWISPLTIGVSSQESQPNSIVSGPSSDFMWFLHISTCFDVFLAPSIRVSLSSLS